MFIYYLLSVAGAFFQTVNGWLFWPGVIVAIAGFREEDGGKIYLLAFWAGLVTDLLTGRFLGTSSVFLLALAAVIYFYRSKFKSDWRALLAILVISQVVAKFL